MGAGKEEIGSNADIFIAERDTIVVTTPQQERQSEPWL